MGFLCKGVCEEFRGEAIPNGSRYNYGQKRCSMCDLFLAVPSVRCPCCGVVLRTNPRGKRQ